MPIFRLNIVFLGVNFDDDDVFDALAELSHVTWRSEGRYAFATAVVEARSALDAAGIVIHQVTTLVPSVRPVRLDDDLVSIPDVAGRVGVTREAVRNWANGTRHANFPLPRGVVGDGIKVWAWSDVSVWLRDNLALGDTEDFPSAQDAASINALIADSGRAHTIAAASQATWSVPETVSAWAEIRPPVHPNLGRPTWIPAAREPVAFTVIDSGLHAAA